MRYEVGIDPKSLCYGFLNELMAHPCSDGSPGITRLGYTKFNEGCTKFCEGCTKGSRMHFEVGNDSKSLFYEFLTEIMANPCSHGGLGSTRLGCTKFHEVVPNFVKNVPMVRKCFSKWRSTPNNLWVSK